MKFFKHPLFWAFIYTILHSVMIYSSEIGITSDSFGYMKIANGVLEGTPFVSEGKVLSHWPPLYQLSIAAVSTVFSVSVFESAKIVSVLLAFIFILLFNLLITKWINDFKFIILSNVILIGCSSIAVFQLALSEGLFMCFLMLLLVYAEKEYSLLDLKKILFIGILSGLLVLIRYAGLGIAAGIGIFILFKYKSFKKALVFTIGFVISVSPWVLFTQLHSGSGSSRELNVHLPAYRHIKGLAGTIYRFVNPSEIIIFGIITAAGVVLFLWWNRVYIRKTLTASKFNNFQNLLLYSAVS